MDKYIEIIKKYAKQYFKIAKKYIDTYYLPVLKKYTVFTGRASRAEYWYYALINAIIGMILAMISNAIQDSSQILVIIYSLAVLLPGLGLTVRRLHDIGRSGKMMFILLLPFAGVIWLLILVAQKEQESTNQYGPNPKANTLKHATETSKQNIKPNTNHTQQ